MLLILIEQTNGQVYGSQSMMESKILDYRGIRFLVKADIEIEATGKGGLGDQFYKVKLTSLSASIHQNIQVDYRGKTYYEYSFNNALAQQFSNIKINTAEITIDLTESKDCKTTTFSVAKQGTSKTILCSVEKGKMLGIARINISDANFTGFSELFALIDKLESQAANQVTNQNTNKTQSDPWGSNEQKSVNTKPVESNNRPNQMPPNNNSKTDAWGTPIKSGSQAPVSKQNAERTTSFDNYNQPIIKVNANGYNTEGQYVGVGKFDKTPGNIFPTGPGKLRVDGLYDVTDKNGNVHIISKSENQKLINQQTDKDVTANMQLRQQQQMQQFQQQQQQFKQQQEANRIREQQISAAADQLAQGIGTIAGAIGNIIADSKAKKEKERQRQYQLEQQRIAEFNRIKAEKDFRRNSRSSLIGEYKQGFLPLSTSKVAADKIYYFVYAFDSSKLDQQGMPFFVSNVVEIARSGDGTWPYQRTINEEIEPLTPYKEYFHGYYLSEPEAEQALQTFKSILQETGASGNEISFRKKKRIELKTSETSNFWNYSVSDDKKKDSTTTISKTSDPLWDVNSEVNNKITVPVKKETDFWTTTEPTKVKIDSIVIKSDSALINIDTVNISSIKKALFASEYKKAMDLFNKLPEETNDLEIEAWRAHCLLLNDQNAKAIEIYKKHKGKKLTTNLSKWESKIQEDIIFLQGKGINHIHFPLIQSIMLF